MKDASYEIMVLNEHTHRLMDEIILMEGEVTDEMQDQLLKTQCQIGNAVDQTKFLLDQLDCHETYWRSRSNEAAIRARRLSALQEKIKDRIKFTMQKEDKKVIEGNVSKFLLTNGRHSLHIPDQDKVSKEYKKEVTTWEVDKEAIRKALEEGTSVRGASLEPVFALRISDIAPKLKGKK